MTVLLIIVLLVFLALVSIVFSTLQTGMSPLPSHAVARSAILQQVQPLLNAKPQAPKTLIDLGSGWGHLVIPLARCFPQHQVVGYEVSFFPWLVSWLLKKGLGLHNLQLYRHNFFQADLSEADLLICYLVRPSMQKLAKQLQQMPSRPSFLLSHFFSLPGYSPVHTWQLPDWYASPLYLYRLDSTENKHP